MNRVYGPSAPAPVRIALVNDCAVVTAGLRAILTPYAHRIAVTDLGRGPVRATDVDIVLLDALDPGPRDDHDVADVVRPGGPKVVVYTWTADTAAIVRSRELGAVACLSKALDPHELVTALETVQTRGRLLGPVGDPADAHLVDDRRAKDVGLSSRETEMMAYIARGLSNREIATQAFLSINSVKTYVRTAYRKAGVHKRSQAVLWALEHEVVLPSAASLGDERAVAARPRAS